MATITITILNDDGTPAMPNCVTTLPQSVLELGAAAVADAYNWTETVANPDYVRTDPTDLVAIPPVNPPTIPNPLNQIQHMLYQWNLFSQSHALSYGVQQADVARTEAIAAIQSQAAQVAVKWG